jgi:sirohydrochlorin cobaltochelatase
MSSCTHTENEEEITMTGLPLLVVGHGTRSDSGVAEFNAFMVRLQRRQDAPYRAAAGGFIELSRPPVTEAVASLVGQGHRELVALPLVLVAAGHGKGDIPASLLREQERYPQMSYTYGRPLGPHPKLFEILERRIEKVLDDADRADTHVLLVGRGSTDPDANAEIAKVARLLWEGRGYADVEPCFVSLADPSVPAGLERLRRLGAGRIVVAPYFLFPGILPDRIVSQANAFAVEHPNLTIGLAEVIGDCDELADVVIERYLEAVGGDIRMNCDTCIYRSTMPGFGDRVGQAQRPHHHPDDAGHEHGDHGHGHEVAHR